MMKADSSKGKKGKGKGKKGEGNDSPTSATASASLSPLTAEVRPKIEVEAAMTPQGRSGA